MGVHISKDTAKGLPFDLAAGNSGFQADEGCVTERDAKLRALELHSGEVHQLFSLTWLDLNSTTCSILKGPRVMDEAFALRGMCLVAHTWVCGVSKKKKEKK